MVLVDSTDEQQQISFYVTSASVWMKFKILFNSYCMSCIALLCGIVLNLSICHLKTDYNRIFGLFFHINGQVSISLNLLFRNLNIFEVLLRKCSFSLHSRLYSSNNAIVNNIVKNMFSTTSKLHQCWDKTLFPFPRLFTLL